MSKWIEATGHHGRSGHYVEGIPCPECGGRITYNGNYHCADCDWINCAVFGGKFTVAQADFAQRLVEQLTGEPERDPPLQLMATDYKVS